MDATVTHPAAASSTHADRPALTEPVARTYAAYKAQGTRSSQVVCAMSIAREVSRHSDLTPHQVWQASSSTLS